MIVCWILLVLGLVMWARGQANYDGEQAVLGLIICFLTGVIGFGIYGIKTESKTQWVERRDFKVIRGFTFATVKMDGREQTYYADQNLKAIDKIKVIHVRQSWNQYGHRMPDRWEF